MKIKALIGILLACITLTSITLPAFTADTLVASDFKQESWAKTIDYFDYARAYATIHGIEAPPDSYHAYSYMTYVNTRGMQMLYSGLCNMTFGGNAYLTIPMQTFMMHYKTENKSRDVVMASTFLMLLAFNDTQYSIYPNSPDMNDTLWSSFSMGFNFGWLNSTFPALDSKTTIIPLDHSEDGLQWTWGMKYTNLTAMWWRTYISPTDPSYDHNYPVAVAIYDELTFTYTLTISPTTHKATLTENHIIGRIRDLWLIYDWFIIPFYNHYDSTGCYAYGTKISDMTVYDFLEEYNIKMSIVNFQTSILLDHDTYSVSTDGQSVTDAEKMVSDSSIITYTDDGEKISEASFGTKETYKLYDYTVDPDEETYETYTATTRTCKINGFAHNTGLFAFQTGLMKFLPLLIYNMYPQLYEKAKECITDMSQANYFYLIAYPKYCGFRVEHDPTYTVYLTTSATVTPPPPANWEILMIICAAVAVASIMAVVMVVRRRRLQPLPS